MSVGMNRWRGRSARHGARGFTAIEVITVLAIIAIMVRLALPSIHNMLMNNSIAAANNQLVASLNYARGEAVSDRQKVFICKTATATTTTPNCDTSTATGYEEGWVIYETYKDSSATATSPSITKVLKIVTPDSTRGITIHGNSGVAQLQLEFNTLGMLPIGTGTADFVLCDTRLFTSGGQFARVVSVNQTGNINSLVGSNSINTVNTCSP